MSDIIQCRECGVSVRVPTTARSSLRCPKCKTPVKAAVSAGTAAAAAMGESRRPRKRGEEVFGSVSGRPSRGRRRDRDANRRESSGSPILKIAGIILSVVTGIGTIIGGIYAFQDKSKAVQASDEQLVPSIPKTKVDITPPRLDTTKIREDASNPWPGRFDTKIPEPEIKTPDFPDPRRPSFPRGGTGSFDPLEMPESPRFEEPELPSRPSFQRPDRPRTPTIRRPNMPERPNFPQPPRFNTPRPNFPQPPNIPRPGR